MATLLPCDVRCLAANAVTVDALARLQLAAKRNGCLIALCNAKPELLELIAFMGLAEVLRPRDGDRSASR
jgi:hypothetical protein